MAHFQHGREPSPWLTRRDTIVALTVGLLLIAGWLWYDWSRNELSPGQFVTGILFLATLLVGVRCLDFVISALAAQFRFRRQVGQFDRRAAELQKRLDELEDE